MALSVIVVFMVIEFVGGLLSGSLALLADATHMFTDALALGLAAIAQRFSMRPATTRLHFGYRRAQVLAAFANGVLMLCLLALILIEAVRRFLNPVSIESGLMLAVAIAGLFANILAFWILHRPDERNLNMRGARLHVLGDLVGSVAAIVAALLIGLTGVARIDPILSLVVVALIGFYAVKLLRKSGHILLEGAPEDLDVHALADDVARASPDIRDVHDVRIWQITPEHPRVMLHICVDDPKDAADAIARAKKVLEDKYGIRQSAIQADIGGDCPDGGLDGRMREATTTARDAAPRHAANEPAHLASPPPAAFAASSK